MDAGKHAGRHAGPAMKVTVATVAHGMPHHQHRGSVAGGPMQAQAPGGDRRRAEAEGQDHGAARGIAQAARHLLGGLVGDERRQQERRQQCRDDSERIKPAGSQALPGGSHLVEIEKNRLMPGRADEAQEVLAPDGSRGVVAQRMTVHQLAGDELRVEHVRDAVVGVVDDRQRRHRSGLDAEHLAQELGPAEGEPRRAQRLGETVEVNPLLVAAGDEPETALPVLEEQVLAVRAGEVAGVLLRFLDREDGRVVEGLGLDAQRRKVGQDLGAGIKHLTRSLL